MKKVAVVNIGLGNLGSLVNIIKKIGNNAILVEEPQDLDNFEKVILPGVGSFDKAIKILTQKGFIKKLVELKEKNIHILGICLGMQILFERSEEGQLEGLGFIKGEVKKFDKKIVNKIPHMGWNIVNIKNVSPLSQDLKDENRFYFVHSYYCVPNDPSTIIFTAAYGLEFTCGVNKDNIFGVQFHPEKSHKFGIQVLKNFMDI